MSTGVLAKARTRVRGDLGDDTPELKPYTDKLMNGEMTFDDYEEMFYAFAKPLKIHRPLIPIPYARGKIMECSRIV